MTANPTTTFGIYEAKTHFASLVERAFAGEILTITRHGRPVARLVPVTGPYRTREEAEAIAARWEAFRQEHGRENIDFRALIGRDEH